MKTLIRTPWILILFVLVVSGASATDSQVETSMKDNERVVTDHNLIRAADYGLTDIELSRYHEIMKGPLGRWYRDLDPTWVLGFASETEEERRHYAAIVAEMEFRRVDNELAFNRAYSEAIAARSKGTPMINETQWQTSKTRNPADLFARIDTVESSRRLSLYVDGGCEDCDERVMQKLHAAAGTPVDIYLANMEDDQAIRKWAQRLRINAEAVKARELTLNHDAGQFAAQIANDRVVIFRNGPDGPMRMEGTGGE